MDVKILKERVCQAIDAHREEIIALGDSIFAEPELGYKEYKTAEKVKKFIDEKIRCRTKARSPVPVSSAKWPVVITK